MKRILLTLPPRYPEAITRFMDEAVNSNGLGEVSGTIFQVNGDEDQKVLGLDHQMVSEEITWNFTRRQIQENAYNTTRELLERWPFPGPIGIVDLDYEPHSPMLGSFMWNQAMNGFSADDATVINAKFDGILDAVREHNGPDEPDPALKLYGSPRVVVRSSKRSTDLVKATSHHIFERVGLLEAMCYMNDSNGYTGRTDGGWGTRATNAAYLGNVGRSIKLCNEMRQPGQKVYVSLSFTRKLHEDYEKSREISIGLTRKVLQIAGHPGSGVDGLVIWVDPRSGDQFDSAYPDGVTQFEHQIGVMGELADDLRRFGEMG